MEKKGIEKKGPEKKGPEKIPAPAGGSPASRDRRAAPPPPPARRRKPAALGIVVAIGAVGAWLLRRERPKVPEGIWRDLLSDDRKGVDR